MERKGKRKFETVGDIVPELVRKYRTFKPTELAEKILADYNTNVTPESVTMFFKRHPEIERQLHAEVLEQESGEIVVSESIFENGTFEELPSVKKWINDITPRVAPETLSVRVLCLKNICRGRYATFQSRGEGLMRERVMTTLEGWSLKSPERLTIEHVKEYIARLHRLGKATLHFRLAARDFFLSRDRIKVSPTDISGDKGQIGKWGKVSVAKDILHMILNYVKERNFEIYVADHFSLATATRHSATFEARKSNMREENGVTVCDVLDKGLHRKGRKMWTKLIPPDLRDEMLWLAEKNGDEIFKNINQNELRELNKEAYRLFLKDDPKALELATHEPFHFWRHMFAQHMLRATGWNYDIVAELGGWSDTNTLKKCYGSPPTEVLRKAGLDYIPTL